MDALAPIGSLCMWPCVARSAFISSPDGRESAQRDGRRARAMIIWRHAASERNASRLVLSPSYADGISFQLGCLLLCLMPYALLHDGMRYFFQPQHFLLLLRNFIRFRNISLYSRDADRRTDAR